MCSTRTATASRWHWPGSFPVHLALPPLRGGFPDGRPPVSERRGAGLDPNRALRPRLRTIRHRHSADAREPYYLTLKDPEPDEVLLFAGSWEPTGEGTGTCCAIVTEPASPAFAFIHDRQLVVLDPERRWQWPDPTVSDRETIRRIARRLIPERLIAYPVSTGVNRPANDGPELLEPVDDSDGAGPMRA